MSKIVHLLFAVILLDFLLSGCSSNNSVNPTTSEPTSITIATPETTVAEVSEASSLPTEEEFFLEEGAEADIPTEMAPPEQGMPLWELPQVSDEPCTFFDDAAIMGDSISYSLMVHNTRTKDLGETLFLVRGSLGIHNALNKQLSIYYQGQSMTPWDALAASGVNKVFLLLGMNDIGYYSIDDTMEKWGVFLENIRTCCPDLQIYIQSLTPMWIGSEQSLLNNENIDLYNKRLQAFAEENDCYFVNIAPYFKNSENGLAAKYAGDLYVHMNEEGTAAWATLLKAYAEEQENQ